MKLTRFSIRIQLLISFVLDSIKTTLNKYYGEDKLIYLSVNSKACLFQNATPQFRISQSEPYMGQNII